MTPDLLVCAGSLTLDNVLTAEGYQLPQSYGGNVLYSALGAHIWHDHVGLVSRAGTDFPAACLEMLAARGLRTEGIRRLASRHGMNVAFCYRPDGSRVRAFPPDAIAGIAPHERQRFIDYSIASVDTRYAIWTEFAPDDADLPDDWLPAIAALHGAAMPVQRHHAIANRMRQETRAWLQVDSPWYDERTLERDDATRLFAQINAILPSEDDVAKSNPGQTIAATLAHMQRQGAQCIVLKRGALGSRIMPAASAPIDIPALPGAVVVDPTGAGDAFCGGFLAGMHLTGEPLQAALYGTVSASFAIAAPGIQGLLAASRDQAQERLILMQTRLATHFNHRQH
ncbi:MAG: carbohydrate kinase family protein [Burkholderiaceae bacterium]